MENDGLQSVLASKPATLIQAILEVAHLRYLIYPYLLHPFQSIKEVIFQWSIFATFWNPIFTPETDIPDLSGKVILITGGE